MGHDVTCVLENTSRPKQKGWVGISNVCRLLLISKAASSVEQSKQLLIIIKFTFIPSEE